VNSARCSRFRALRLGGVLGSNLPVKAEQHPTDGRAYPGPTIGRSLVDERRRKVGAATLSELHHQNTGGGAD
jgi:hypothetical protein